MKTPGEVAEAERKKRMRWSETQKQPQNNLMKWMLDNLLLKQHLGEQDWIQRANTTLDVIVARNNSSATEVGLKLILKKQSLLFIGSRTRKTSEHRG